MNRKYKKYLMTVPSLYKAAESLNEKNNDMLSEIVINVISPVIYLFAERIVAKAVQLGIRRLYFLARDGYSVMKAAEIICNKKNIDIELVYLYCSRYSLRMAAYRFKDNTAYERFFYECYSLTAANVLSRGAFTPDERKAVYNEIGFDPNDENALLDRYGFREFCNKLKKSVAFNKILTDRSDSAYNTITDYFKENKMDCCEHIGLVDSGWTGSMQHTIKKLLISCGIDCQVTGFYIGMLTSPPKAENNSFDTWLFDGKGDHLTKAWFSQNLFECLCTAPHGMTMGYKYSENGILPVLDESYNSNAFTENLSEIIGAYAEKVSDFKYNESQCRKIALKLLKALMFNPSKAEADAFDNFLFCDDVTEKYHNKLSVNADKNQLTDSILHRKNTVRLYWFYGSLVRSDAVFKFFYQYSYYLSEVLRFFLSDLK